MNGYPTDRLVAGSIVGGIVTAFAVVLLTWLDFPAEHHFNVYIRLAVPVLLSACVLFPRPLLMRTVLHKRRDPTLLDEDLNHVLLGRALGLVGGLFIGITLAAEIL
jgi:ABC-type enterobactin transport system permease subunit